MSDENYIIKTEDLPTEDTTTTPHSFNFYLDFSGDNIYDHQVVNLSYNFNDNKSYMMFLTWHDNNQVRDYAIPVYYRQQLDEGENIELNGIDDYTTVISTQDGTMVVGIGYHTIDDTAGSDGTDKVKLVCMEWLPKYCLDYDYTAGIDLYEFYISNNTEYLQNSQLYSEFNDLSDGFLFHMTIRLNTIYNLTKFTYHNPTIYSPYEIIELTGQEYDPNDEIVCEVTTCYDDEYLTLDFLDSTHNNVCLKKDWQGERYIIEQCTVSNYSAYLSSMIYQMNPTISMNDVNNYILDNTLSSDHNIIPIGLDLLVKNENSTVIPTNLDLTNIYSFINSYNNNWSNLNINQSKPIKLDDNYDGGYYILQKCILTSYNELVYLIQQASSVTVGIANGYAKLYVDNDNNKILKKDIPLICTSMKNPAKLTKNNFDKFKESFNNHWGSMGVTQKFPIKNIPSTLTTGLVNFFSFNLYPNSTIIPSDNDPLMLLDLGTDTSCKITKVSYGLKTETTNTDYGAIVEDDTIEVSMNAMTLAFWIKSTSSTSRRFIGNKRKSNPWIHIYGTRLVCNLTTTTETNTTLASSAVSTSEYRHIVVTIQKIYRNSTYYYCANAYINGVKDSNEVLSTEGATASSDIPFSIKYIFGIDNSDSTSTGGQGGVGACLDEFGIWDRVLTDNEVAELYRAGNDGVSYPFQSYSPA